MAAPRRALFVDDRETGLRVSWHPERSVVHLSLWREDVCVGTFRLPLQDAERLGSFLAEHLNAAEAAAS